MVWLVLGSIIWFAHGLGQAKVEIAAVFELARRLARSARRDRPKLATPEAVADMLAAELSALRQEQFYCLPLDPRARLLGNPVFSAAVILMEPAARLFFRTALMAGAASAIAVHNHPSGDQVHPGGFGGDQAFGGCGTGGGLPIA